MKHIPDLLMIAGASALSYGCWLVYQPAGYIVPGILLIVTGIKMAAK